MSVVRRRSRAVAVAFVVALGVAGCNDEAPRADPPTRETTSAVPEPGQPASVSLIDAGAEPRRVVELEVLEGHTESSMLALTTTTDVDAEGARPITVPMTIPFTTTVAEATDDRVTVEVRYGKASVKGGGLTKDELARARKSVGYLEGVTVSVSHDRSGRVLRRDVSPGDEAPDLVSRLLDDVFAKDYLLAVPFPTDEVGVGARWEVASTISVGGSTATIDSTYELTELTDAGYTVTVTSTQTDVPDDTLAGRVVEGSSTATGTVRGRTGGVGPVEAVGEANGSSTVEVGGQTVTTTYAVTVGATTR
ncbi:MAG: DUF6263 family protein [Propionibacteriales bacterium]|nr:DUF6263 family protein [Propionibacteriales bacterium]